MYAVLQTIFTPLRKCLDNPADAALPPRLQRIRRRGVCHSSVRFDRYGKDLVAQCIL